MYFHPTMIETLRQPDYYLVKTFDDFGLYDERVHFNYRPLFLYKVRTIEANNYACFTKCEYRKGKIEVFVTGAEDLQWVDAKSYNLAPLCTNDFLQDNFLVVHISDLPKIMPICAKLCNALVRPFYAEWRYGDIEVRLTSYQQPLD